MSAVEKKKNEVDGGEFGQDGCKGASSLTLPNTMVIQYMCFISVTEV